MNDLGLLSVFLDTTSDSTALYFLHNFETAWTVCSSITWTPYEVRSDNKVTDAVTLSPTIADHATIPHMEAMNLPIHL